MSVVSPIAAESEHLERRGQSSYRICTFCIMDTSDPEIAFDAEGVCNHCRRYHERVRTETYPPGKRECRLQELVARIKERGKNREYDCIIGVSGGVDSTTVAWTVKSLGLRPLAVHFDNGWNSELAVDNIHKTLEKLGIELYTYVVDWEEFRDLQLSFLRASVPNCEIPTDHGLNATLFRTAAMHGIPYILNGSNLRTEAIMPLRWGYYHQDLKHIKAIHRQFGSILLKTMPTLSIGHYFYYILALRIRYIPLLNYIDYDKAKAMELIQRELGWRPYGGKHYESIYTRFFQGYILPRKFGYDKRRAHLSTLISSGGITRDEALKEMERDPYGDVDPAADREFVIKKLGLTSIEFDDIMRLSPREHTEYPTYHFIFHEMKAAKELFKRIAKSG